MQLDEQDREDQQLVKTCGSESMVDRVKSTWNDMISKNRLDLSGQRLADDGVQKLLKGLHLYSRLKNFQADNRTKPFPLHELDFSGNELTKAGIADVVQFARTQGADATLIDLSNNELDDEACMSELTRLVKNYSSFAAQALPGTITNQRRPPR